MSPVLAARLLYQIIGLNGGIFFPPAPTKASPPSSGAPVLFALPAKHVRGFCLGTIVGRGNLITENDGALAMYIRPKDVEKGELLIDDINYVTNDRHDSVMPDTVLVDSYPPFTRSYLVRKRDVPCIASPNFSIVVPNKDYLPDYVHAFFRSSMFVDRARRLSSGKYITLEDLKSIRIPIASKEVQQKIVDSTSSSANDPDDITSAFRSFLS